MPRSRRPLLAAGALLALTAPAVRAQTTYTFTDLGVLNPASPYCKGVAINNAGQILAHSRNASGYGRMVRITPTTDGQGRRVWFTDVNNDGVNDLMQALPLPAGKFLSAFANASAGINASGQTTAQAVNGTSLPQDGVAWSASGIATLLTPTTVSSNGCDINDGGDIAGSYYDYKKRSAIVQPCLFRFVNGSYSINLFAPTSDGSALAINNLRQIVGMVGSGSPFLYLPAAAYGLPQGLNLIAGMSINNQGKMLNNSGIICGLSAASHLCLWVPPGAGAAYGLTDGVNDLGTGGWAHAIPTSLNNPPSGQPLRVVGQIDDTVTVCAYVWDSATRTFQNLNAVTVNLPAGWVMEQALGINDLGQIVGQGRYNGVFRGFILAPQ